MQAIAKLSKDGSLSAEEFKFAKNKALGKPASPTPSQQTPALPSHPPRSIGINYHTTSSSSSLPTEFTSTSTTSSFDDLVTPPPRKTRVRLNTNKEHPSPSTHSMMTRKRKTLRLIYL